MMPDDARKLWRFVDPKPRQSRRTRVLAEACSRSGRVRSAPAASEHRN